MEPQTESLWCTSMYNSEEEVILEQERSWEMPFVEESSLSGCRFERY